MKEKLYIIGNGFDLHHKLKTSYYDFAQHLKSRNSELYHLLESYISYPKTDKDLWARFEENLANLDTNEILSEHSDRLPDYASDEFRDRDRYVFPDIMDDYFEKLTKGLIGEFQTFIQEVQIPQIAKELRLELDIDSSFLTFNYTNTLERLYNIAKTNITYIHNSAIYGNEEIILGHGIDPKNFEEKRPEPPDNVDPEDYEKWYKEHDDWEYSYDTGRESLLKYFAATFKQTSKIISTNRTFFSSLDKTKEVCILGHSLSSIDLPYFNEIHKRIGGNVEWKATYYSNCEHDHHLDTLIQLGISKSNIELFEMSDLQQNHRHLKIDFENSEP